MVLVDIDVMSRFLSIVLISEIYLLEVNGVVNILGCLYVGFQQFGYWVQVVCLCQFGDDGWCSDVELVLICGWLLFGYFGL